MGFGSKAGQAKARATGAGSDTMSHPVRRLSVPDHGQFLDTLARLRWLALLGQALAIAVVAHGMDIALPLAPLAAGMAVLAGFNLWLAWRGEGRPASVAAILGHLALDLGVLAWQLYWSGGPANPFVSLFVVPIALAAVSLPARAVVAAALLAVACYSLLWWRSHPLPHLHGEFDLHLFGMWVNFVITAGVVAVFGTRIAATLSAQRAALAEARERSLRDEGLLAVATLAAGAAHALNTPLSTMSVVLADLRDGLGDVPAAAQDELALLERQVEACRGAVEQMVAEARPLAEGVQPLGERIEAATTRWRLLRPAFALAVDIDVGASALPVGPDRGLDHLLINLLDNAADASQAAGERDVALSATREDRFLVLAVRDRGAGMREAPAPFRSGKPHGLGLGLALAERICERYGGSLSFDTSPAGTTVRGHLALAALEGVA